MSNSDKKVFVTGASGFICSQILALLIKEGYQVVATVRSPTKAELVLSLHPEWKGKVEFVFVPEISTAGAFDQVIKATNHELDYVIHTASPVNFSVKDVKTDLIDPAVHGTTEIMKAVHEFGGPQVKRFVLLTSSVAIIDSTQDMSVAGRDRNEKDWNPVTEEEAVRTNNPVLGYNVSKVKAEKAAWEFLATQKPSFDLAAINPDIVLGPMLQPVPGPKNVNETNAFAIYNFLNGTYKDIDTLFFPFYHWVDVRDVARAHVLALTNPKSSNQRHLLASSLVSPQLIINIIRENFPELKDRIIEGNPDQLLPKGVQPTGWDTRKSFEIFGPEWKYRTLEESVVDTVKCLLELEAKWTKST